MFRTSISLFAVIVNLAFFVSCDTLVEFRPADYYTTDNVGSSNVGSSNRVKRKWIFESENNSAYSDGTDGNDDLAVLPLPSWPYEPTLQNNLYFHLYTKKNPTIPHELKIDSRWQLRTSHFDISKPTVFITHGWINTGNSSSCTLIRDAYLSGPDDINVIVVDWSYFSGSLYSWAVESVEGVGKAIANVINWLKSIGYVRLDSITLVGHSLGAHVMGIVGRNTNGTINQIFGLDPASISFERPSKLRISKDCARQVQIIHTNGNQLGLWQPIGHSDFYPNGGMKQPGCYLDPLSMGYCSHGRAFEYFAESLNSPIGFKALRCKPGQSPYRGECTGRLAVMGGRSNYIDYSGKYYTKTKRSSPYAVRLLRTPRPNNSTSPSATSA